MLLAVGRVSRFAQAALFGADARMNGAAFPREVAEAIWTSGPNPAGSTPCAPTAA